jgi:hypothetical protein
MKKGGMKRAVSKFRTSGSCRASQGAHSAQIIRSSIIAIADWAVRLALTSAQMSRQTDGFAVMSLVLALAPLTV